MSRRKNLMLKKIGQALRKGREPQVVIEGNRKPVTRKSLLGLFAKKSLG